MKKIGIIGAGVSGLSAGWKLAQAGHEVCIFESNAKVGGLAGTQRDGPYSLDFGPHSFHTVYPEIQQTVLDLFDHSLKSCPRSAKLYYQGKFLDYPLSPTNVLFNMGTLSGIRSILSYLKSQLQGARGSGDEISVEQWAIRNFGNHLYQAFFKPYTEQFWRMPSTELSSRTIPSHTRLSFMHALKLLFQRKISEDKKSLMEREKMPTYYPNTGYDEISQKIAQSFVEAGGKLYLQTKIQGLRLHGEGIQLVSGVSEIQKEHSFDQVISTLPLSALMGMMEPMAPSEVLVAARELWYRPLLVLGIMTPKRNILGCQYVYYLNRPYNRVSEMTQFSERTCPPGGNVLSLEIPCTPQSREWYMSREELFRHCLGALERDGIIAKQDVAGLMLIKSRYAYPIYRMGYDSYLKKVLNFIDQIPGLYTLGRLGEFRYGDIDVCMKQAFELADRIEKKDAVIPSARS